ncbi:MULTISPECIES: hypothetical protein [unclassified Curtobacterium]
MPEHVIVIGPHGRHMNIHPAIQAAFPDRYPLVIESPKPDRSDKSDKGE